MKRAIIVLVIIAAIGAGAGAYYVRRGGQEITVNTSPVSRGDVIDTVASTGTLQAVITVTVGAQVSGKIAWLGADFNSIVKKDQVIAKLDPLLFQTQLEQSKANMNQAQANLIKARADLERMKVALLSAQQMYDRMQALFDRKLETQADLDLSKIAVDTAKASLDSQDATVKQTEAAVTQAQASVDQNQTNLEYCTITAPIDGIVTQRSVDVGQTVQSSMTAPTLFLLAADLTKMQVAANIDESDVGRVRPGQRTTFRVDAYPGETFVGTVSQIRLNPAVVSNVVTYSTMIDVPNLDLRLKPGMTANLKVEVSRKNNVLRVSNAATRFRPTLDLFAALNEPVPPEALGRGGRGNGARANAGGAGGGPNAPVASGTPQPAAGAQQEGSPGATRQRGDGQGGGGGGRGGFGRGGDPAQAMERFKAMAPDQQQQFIERMKARGQDTSAFEAAIAKPVAQTAFLTQPRYGAIQTGATIDALFAPLPPQKPQTGRVWLYVDKQLKPVTVRLGITDGTFTELVDDSLPASTEVVTTVIGLGGVRPAAAAATGNPLLGNQQRGGGPGPGRGF